MKSKLVSIKNQKNDSAISSPAKSSLMTKILSKIAIFPQTEKLYKTSEKYWHVIHPTDAECEKTLEKAIKAKNKEQIFAAVAYANPATATGLIKRGISELQKYKGYDVWKEFIPTLKSMIDPLNIKIESFQFEKLADAEKYDEISRIIDEQKNEADAKLSSLYSFQSILRVTLSFISLAQNPKSKELRLKLIATLYDHVAAQKENSMFPYYLKEAIYSLPSNKSHDKDFEEYYTKFEKLKNDIPIEIRGKFRL